MRRIVLTFALALALDAAAAAQTPPKTEGERHGIGSGAGRTDVERGREPVAPDGANPVRQKAATALKIVSKPRAVYTDRARAENVQGKVVLRVTFKADATIGKIKVVEGLPFGLNERAVEAARRMRFEPATANGRPVTIVKAIEYNFTIY